MKTKIVDLGGSPAIRIPQTLLEQCALKDEVEMEAGNGCLIVRAASGPRQGWETAFRDMAGRGDDHLILNDRAPATQWDNKEWEW